MLIRKRCLPFLLLLVGLVATATADSDDSNQPECRGPQSGILYIHGGGGKSTNWSYPEFFELARQVSPTQTPSIVVITTAGGRGADDKMNYGPSRVFKEIFGEENVSVIHTLSREVADSDEFTAPIDAADAVWMSGGEQVHLAETFLGTKTEESLQALLGRGGVIGGTSAGAQIQSSFMTRGIVRGDRILGTGRHQRGFGFISNTAFDVHVAARRRKDDLFELFATQTGQLTDQNLDPKTLLGIGLDEHTAIIVRQDQFEVVGDGHVYVFNPHEWNSSVEPFYHTLSAGDRYDLRERRSLRPTESDSTPPTPAGETAAPE